MQTAIIINQILVLAILIGIGFGASRKGMINEAVKKGLADLIFNISLPLLILTTMAKLELTPTIIKNSGLVVIWSYVGLIMLHFSAKLGAKLLALHERSKAIFLVHSVYGNIIFLGFPLLDALFPGGEGIFYATLFQLVSNSLMWTSGIYILNKSNTSSFLANLKNLINPNTLAFFVGLILMLLQWRLPEILQQSLGGLGKTTIYMAMLYIGAMLSQISFKGVFASKSVWALGLNKLLFIPVLLIVSMEIVLAIFQWEMHFIAKAVVVLQTAMPCQATIVVLAKKYAQNDVLATENLFLTTILSLISLPTIYWFLLKIPGFIGL